MKRKEKKPLSNKVIRGFVWSFGVAFIGLGVRLYSQNQLIQAKPDDGTNTPVVVDRGTAEEYQLPYDATKLFEPEIISQTPKFDSYVQNSSETVNLTKATNFYMDKARTDVFQYPASSEIVKVQGEADTYVYMTGYNREKNATTGLLSSTYEITKVKSDGTVLSRTSIYDWVTHEPSWYPKGTFYNNEDDFIGNPVHLDNKNGTATIIYSIKGWQPRLLTYNTKTLEMIGDRVVSKGGWGVGYTSGERYTTSGINNGELATLYDVNNAVARQFETPNLSKSGLANVSRGRIEFGVNTMHRLSDGSVAGMFSHADFGENNQTREAVIWNNDSVRKIKKSFGITAGKKNNVTFISQLSNSEEAYYWYGEEGSQQLKLIRYSVATQDFSEVAIFPAGTSIQFEYINNELWFIGYAPKSTHVFSDYKFNNATIAGKMDSDFSVKTLSQISSNQSLTFSRVANIGDNKFLTIGTTNNVSNFVTESGFQGVNLGFGDGLFYGTLKIIPDYSPIIEKVSNISLDIENLKDQPSIKDSLLLSNGRDNQNIRVYDNFDINSSLSAVTEADYQNKINKNINTYDLGTAQYGPIDWEALGFEDNGKIGPNRVTYFVTDSQKQTTSTSRIVNKIDSHTVLNKKGAIGAYNFGIKLADVGNLTDASLRDPSAYAQLMAWDLDDETVDVLSLPTAQGVEINSTQLDAIRHATEFGVFDLTFTLNYGDEPKEVTIKVFVSEDGPVDGFSYDVQENEIPWDLSRNITGEAYPNSEYAKIKAYKISTGEKIDKNNTSYQIKADVGALNAADPNPADYTATQAVKVPLAIWTKDNTPTKEIDVVTIPDTTVYYRVEDVKIAFTDWNFGTLYDVDGNTLQAAGVELKNQIVGKTTAIKTNQEVVDAINAISLKGYEKEKFYLSDKQTELTTDGLEIVFNEGKGYHYYLRFKGLLELVSVPSKIDFGQGESTLGTMRKNDPTVTGNLVISDTRADTTKNWTLKAELSKPMTSLSGNTVIPDAIRYKRSGQAEFILDANKQVMLANNAGTFGTFNVSDTWGTGKDDDGFKFEAQAVKVHEIGTYQATIKYTLSDTYEP